MDQFLIQHNISSGNELSDINLNRRETILEIYAREVQSKFLANGRIELLKYAQFSKDILNYDWSWLDLIQKIHPLNCFVNKSFILKISERNKRK